MFKQATKSGSADQAETQHAPKGTLHRGDSRQPAAWTRALDTLPLQTKLTINQPGDAYEHEADRVAAQVMRMPDPAASGGRRCACGGIADASGECAACRAKRLSVQRKSDSEGGMQAPASVHDVLRSPGQPLDSATRAFMEPRFGYDFGAVRVHTDSRAAESAKAISAHAYTVGQSIVFADGRYAPGTDAGNHLLAHELAHTVQQGQAASAGPGPALARMPRQQLQRAAFADHCGTVGAATGDACGGAIDVRATTISVAALAVSHLFVVFTPRRGQPVGFRGGPDSQGGGYGKIATICDTYDEHFPDWDTAAPSERVYEGDDACRKAACMHDELATIAGTDTPYVPLGPNSNSVVGHLLRHCGLPVRKPTVTAPGFDLEITPQGAIPNPQASDRRQRLSLGIAGIAGGPLGGADLSAGYSVDVATALHMLLRFPLQLDAHYISGPTPGLLGGASIGVEAPFLNISPGSYRFPTTLGLYGGVLGGAARDLSTPGNWDPLLGFQGRFVFGIDIGRVRLDPYYQLEVLQNLSANQTLVEHILGLGMGYTF